MEASSSSSSMQERDDDLHAAPLLELQPPTKQSKTAGQKAVRKAFKGTAHLANLLPTGSVMTFQVMSPVITHGGHCLSFVSRTNTAALLCLCAASCFLLSFTDSFRDERGKVRYGLASLRGLRVLDGGSPPPEAEKFRIRPVDFLHAVMSVVVFASVAMFNGDVVSCLYPEPSEEAMEILRAAPVMAGVVCSLMFVLFPTRRHGIGFPLSRR